MMFSGELGIVVRGCYLHRYNSGWFSLRELTFVQLPVRSVADLRWMTGTDVSQGNPRTRRVCDDQCEPVCAAFVPVKAAAAVRTVAYARINLLFNFGMAFTTRIPVLKI